MNAIKATFTKGQIVPDTPVSWEEGCRLLVQPESSAEIEFLTEAEQSDDPESIQRWIEELRAVPPVPMTAEQEANLLAWREKAKAFNLEAVRRQMEEGLL